MLSRSAVPVAPHRLRAHSWRRTVLACAAAGVAALSALPAAQPADAAPQSLSSGSTDWVTVKHAKRGFMIAYPASLFTPQAGMSGEDGRVFASPDGQARLLVGTFENTADFNLASYRDYLVKENYTGAKLDYERMKDKWFVISGTRGDTMFYERVTFTCGGKLVNSWAMLYPVAERRTYDRVVEAVARSYQPGAGASGNCD